MPIFLLKIRRERGGRERELYRISIMWRERQGKDRYRFSQRERERNNEIVK